MNTSQILDYNYTTPEERLAYIKTQLPHLAQLNPTQLDTCANYLLQYTSTKPTLEFSQVYLEDLHPDLTQTNPIKYTHPKTPPNWANLPIRTKAINQLKILEAAAPAQLAYNYRKIRIDLTKEAALETTSQLPKPYAPTQPPHPIDISPLIDLTNPFHIKQILKLYSQLKQSPESWEFMEYFDQICTKANLHPWQEHILLRQIDGVNQITIGIELAQQFNKPITPSYLSQAKRTIYRKIAKAAANHALKFKRKD